MCLWTYALCAMLTRRRSHSGDMEVIVDASATCETLSLVYMYLHDCNHVDCDLLWHLDKTRSYKYACRIIRCQGVETCIIY